MKLEERIEKYVNDEQVDEKVAKGQKVNAVKDAAMRVRNSMDKNLKGNQIKKPIIETLTDDPYFMDKKEAEQVANSVLSNFLKEDDELNIENVMKKLIKRYMRGM